MNKLSSYLVLILLPLYLSCEKPSGSDEKQVTENSSKPNFLFILADDQRYSTIRDWGNEDIITPNLDKLSQSGTSFTNAHIMGAMNGAVCAPSRAMLMTGRSVFHIIPSGEDIEEGHTTLPQHLSSNGYRTFHTGKWHNGKPAFSRSFTDGDKIFFGGMSDHYNVPLNAFDASGNYPKEKIFHEKKHSTEIYADAAINFLDNYNADDPFFMYVAFQAPHDPKQVPEEFIKMYDPEQVGEIPNFLPEHPFDNGELDIRDEWLTEVPRKEEEIKMHMAAYYAMVTHVDHEVGRILEALEKSGKAENTYIIFSADNGIAMGQHGLMGKQNLYEHSIRVPLIMAGPSIPKNQKTNAFTYLIDIFPTLSEIAGLEVPETVDGKSLFPILKGEDKKGREQAVFAYKSQQRAIKKDEYKLLTYQVNGEQTDQLFNMEEDPWEMNNLAKNPEYKDKIAELKSSLTQELSLVGDSAKVAEADWNITPIIPWIQKIKNNPETLERLKRMAEEENDMVKGYFE